MFIQVLSAMMCYAIFLVSKNGILHSKIECTANYFTAIQSLRLSKTILLVIEIISKVHIHLSIAHRMSRMQNQEIEKFQTTYPSPIVTTLKIIQGAEKYLQLHTPTKKMDYTYGPTLILAKDITIPLFIYGVYFYV